MHFAGLLALRWLVFLRLLLVPGPSNMAVAEMHLPACLGLCLLGLWFFWLFGHLLGFFFWQLLFWLLGRLGRILVTSLRGHFIL